MTDTELVSDGVMTPDQAAEFLTLTRAEVYRLCGRGELRSLKIGRHRKIPRREAERFLADRLDRATGGPDPAA